MCTFNNIIRDLRSSNPTTPINANTAIGNAKGSDEYKQSDKDHQQHDRG